MNTVVIPDIITIKGAPGSGKTITSKNLAKYYPSGARIEIDTIRSMVISVDWTNQDEHISIISLSVEIVRGFLVRGYRPVIIVDTFSGDKLNDYLVKLTSINANISVRSFALIVDEDELEKRLKTRKSDEFRDFYISTKLNQQVAMFLHPSENLFDTTKKTPKEIAKRIFESINNAISKVQQ